MREQATAFGIARRGGRARSPEADWPAPRPEQPRHRRAANRRATRGAGEATAVTRRAGPATSTPSCCPSSPASPCSTRPTRAPRRPPPSSGPEEAEFTGPTADEQRRRADRDRDQRRRRRAYNAMMISNNAGDQIVPAVQQAARRRASRSSPGTRRSRRARARACSSPRSTSTRPAQVMADMALDILGETAARSPSCRRRRTPPTRTPGSRRSTRCWQGSEVRQHQARRHRLRQRRVREESYNQALALVDKHPDLEADHGTDDGRHRCRRARPCRTRACATRSRSPASACRPR